MQSSLPHPPGGAQTPGLPPPPPALQHSRNHLSKVEISQRVPIPPIPRSPARLLPPSSRSTLTPPPRNGLQPPYLRSRLISPLPPQRRNSRDLSFITGMYTLPPPLPGPRIVVNSNIKGLPQVAALNPIKGENYRSPQLSIRMSNSSTNSKDSNSLYISSMLSSIKK